MVNALFHIDKFKINNISEKYGDQAVILGCDYICEKKNYITVFNNAKKKSLIFEKYLVNTKKIFFGELLLNSVEKDGTGQGFDQKVINSLNKINKPIILMGGAGKFEHFIEILKNNKIDAAATGNLFNFLGNGLEFTRSNLIKKKIRLVSFN